MKKRIGWLGLGLAAACAVWSMARASAARQETNRLLRGRKILILGAGFGGIQVALDLAKALPPEDEQQILLIDEQNYLLFTPMLTEVAGGMLDPRHIVSPLRQLSPNVNSIQGRVEEIDLRNRRVEVSLEVFKDRVQPVRRTFEADFIVLALGAVTNYFGIPGLMEYAFPMKTLGDAVNLNGRALSLLERANAEPDAETRRTLLTFVVGGGGFSGVETVASLNDLVRDAAQHYPNVRPEEIRTILVHSRDRLLPELDEDLARYAQNILERNGVEILLNTRITGADRRHVELDGSRTIPTCTLVWAAGMAVNPVVTGLECAHGKRGEVRVNAHCELEEYPGVWAVGDCAEVPKPDGTGSYAGTAQNSIRQGALVARNILATLRGEPQQPFQYEAVAELALVGKREGIARIYNYKFSGLLAWMLWRGVYLSKLPDRGDRIRVGIDWFLDLFFGREIAVLPNTRSLPAEMRHGVEAEPVKP